jgi:transcriptional regulator with XRE-family HTH domain
MPTTLAKTHEESLVAFKAFERLANRLGLSLEQQALVLGVTSKSIRRYAAGSSHPAETQLERLSLVLNIYADLRSIFRSDQDIRLWLDAPNDALGGSTPLTRLSAGTVGDLIYVRQLISPAL